MQPASKQTRDDRRRLLANLPEGAKRVQVKAPDGRMQYKHPSDVDVDLDEILLASDGSPIIMRGNPGRRPKTVLKPVNPQTAQVADARDDHITTNPLVSSAKDNPEGDAVLDAIVIAMAEEAAAVEFERMEAERHGEPTSNISAKRARILKGMADTYLKRREKMDSLIDLDSPAFQALFALILETFKDSMLAAGTRPEHVETIFAKLVASLGDEGWKQDAKRRMKEKMG
jgi:hypothetical protein